MNSPKVEAIILGRRSVRAVAALTLFFFSAITAFAGLEAGTEFSNSSLHGSYVYRNTTDGVASFGVIRFDGAGKLDLEIRVNALSAGGERSTASVTGTGTFQVEASGIGTAAIAFKGIVMDSGEYDFVIVSAEDGIAQEIFAVLRSGGINNQLVLPTWTRRSDPPGK